MRNGTLVACAIAVVVGLIASAAIGEVRSRTATTVSLQNPERGHYLGDVESTRPVCRKGSTVRVYHDESRKASTEATR